MHLFAAGLRQRMSNTNVNEEPPKLVRSRTSSGGKRATKSLDRSQRQLSKNLVVSRNSSSYGLHNATTNSRTLPRMPSTQSAQPTASGNAYDSSEDDDMVLESDRFTFPRGDETIGSRVKAEVASTQQQQHLPKKSNSMFAGDEDDDDEGNEDDDLEIIKAERERIMAWDRENVYEDDSMSD